MEPRTLLLLLSGILALTQTWAAPKGPTANPGHASSPTPGSHTLTYVSTTMYEPGGKKYRYTVDVYLDDTKILSYDSNTRNSTLQLRVSWIERRWVEQEGAQFWKNQTREIKDNERWSRANLNKLRVHYNQSEDGSHILKEVTGCAVGSNGSFLHGFSKFTYNGTDCIFLNKNMSSWTGAVEGSCGYVLRVPEVGLRGFFLNNTCVDRLQLLHKNNTLIPADSTLQIIIIIMGIAAALGLLGAVVTGAVLWRKKCSGRDKKSYCLAAGSDSAQGSEVSLTANNADPEV